MIAHAFKITMLSLVAVLWTLSQRWWFFCSYGREQARVTRSTSSSRGTSNVVGKKLKMTRKAKMQAHATHEGNGLLVWLWCVHYCVNSCITLHNQQFRVLDYLLLDTAKALKDFITEVWRLNFYLQPSPTPKYQYVTMNNTLTCIIANIYVIDVGRYMLFPWAENAMTDQSMCVSTMK